MQLLYIVLDYKQDKYHKHGKLCVNFYTVITYKNIGISVSVSAKISKYLHIGIGKSSRNIGYRQTSNIGYRQFFHIGPSLVNMMGENEEGQNLGSWDMMA